MLFVIAIATVLIATASGQTCPQRWTQIGENCYYFITSEMSWFAADQYCTYLLPGTFKVHLVSLETIEEHNALKSVINANAVLRNRDFWTSGNNVDVYMGWKWSSVNQRIYYTMWAPGEPNNSGNCIQMWSDEQHLWDDAPCSSPVNFICEIAVTDIN